MQKGAGRCPTLNASDIQTVSQPGEAGGQPSDVPPDMHGIVRQMTETYLVGGYRYTTLADAIAQARRMAKQEPVSP
ncbi:hypothetical protein [Qipengyuania sp.]|uniref:hypothetical protein n=1 Tax=Qipengyuania sp. TaxID=2004515 RepID=UPI0035C85246